MPRHTRHKSKTRQRDDEVIDEMTFRQRKERDGIEPHHYTSAGRAVYRILPGGAR